MKTIVAAGKTPSNVRNGGVTLVIPRRMYARPFHNEDETTSSKTLRFSTNDAGKKTWPQCSRVAFKTPNFTSIAAGSGQIRQRRTAQIRPKHEEMYGKSKCVRILVM